MSENQLREAYGLMKQGDKRAAARIVQNVLKEDRSNASAWWLFATVLEDEEKIVKSLEKVLALNPEHPGARKRLAELRPEYAHLAPKISSEKVKSPQIAEKAKPAKQSISVVGLATVIGIVAVVLLLGVGVVVLINDELAGTNRLEDNEGATPQTVAADYYEAMYREDIDTLYAITCPARHEKLDEMVDDFAGFNPANVSVDLSNTEFELYHHGRNLAYVQIYWTMTTDFGDGLVYHVDWIDDARSEGYDGYGIFFERIEGIWYVCNPYSLPDLQYNDE